MASLEGRWPVGRFYFKVDIGGEEMSFQEVTGLEMSTTPMKYRHGDSEFFYPIKTPGLMECPDLVCKKGIFADDEDLPEFIDRLVEEKEFYNSEDDERLEILVELLNESGETVKAWNIEGAFPIKYSTTGFKSDANEIAIEEMVFAYERIKVSADGA